MENKDKAVWSMTQEILDAIKAEARREGAQEAISWLEEVYGEGIRATDAWAEYMDDEDEDEEEA